MDESAGELPSQIGLCFHEQPTKLTKESILTVLKTMMDDAEAKNIISMGEATYGLQLVEKLHGLNSEAELSAETLFVNAKTMSEAEEVENTSLTDQCTTTLQIVEELHQQGDETGISVPPSEITNKVIDSSANTISEHDEVELSRETTFVSAKTKSEDEEVETTTSIDLVTNNTLQLLEELHQQDDETGTSVPSSEFSNKVNDSYAKALSQDDKVENCTSTGQATYPGQLVEDLPRQESETELTIPSVEEAKPVSNDEVENIIVIDHANGLQIVEELCQEIETRFSDENVVNMKSTLNSDGIKNTISTGQGTNDSHLADDLSQRGDETKLGFLSKNSKAIAETGLQAGTVCNIEVLVVEEMKAAEESRVDVVEWEGQKHEKTKLKSTLTEKMTDIAEELESLKAEMDQNLKKIEEIAEQVVAIDTEISQMEFQCSESKCRHAEFIELFKLIAESQLPLRSHREIKLFMKKKDNAAQEFLSKALDLQFNIEARAKLKLILQEEGTELGKLVEAQKLQMHQKLKENDEVKEFEELVDPDMESQCSESKLTSTNCCRKRKPHPGEELVEEELCVPERAKRMALNAVDSLQECIDQGMVTDP